jgi:hypothetical protein
MFAGILPLGFYFFLARGGRECATDGPLIFFSTLAIYALTRARTSRRWLAVVGVASGLAILSKGLAGLLPLGVAALTVLLVPGFVALGLSGLMLTAGIAFAVVAPWLGYELVSNGAMFWTIFVKQETLFRVASHIEVQRQAAAATLPTFLREVRYLWVVALPLAGLAAAAIKRGGRLSLRRLPPAVWIWLLWLVLGLGAACAVQTKLGWYVLPALLPVALLCGSILAVSLRGIAVNHGGAPALAALALLILAGEAPGHWRFIDHSFRIERERSRPTYVLGMRARAAGESRGDAELFFDGVELPALVYYSGMRAHFVAVYSEAIPDVPFHQLVLRDPDGTLATVGNLDDEWNLSGPPEERVPAENKGGLCRSAGESPPPSDLRLSMFAHDQADNQL